MSMNNKNPENSHALPGQQVVRTKGRPESIGRTGVVESVCSGDTLATGPAYRIVKWDDDGTTSVVDNKHLVEIPPRMPGTNMRDCSSKKQADIVTKVTGDPCIFPLPPLRKS